MMRQCLSSADFRKISSLRFHGLPVLCSKKSFKLEIVKKSAATVSGTGSVRSSQAGGNPVLLADSGWLRVKGYFAGFRFFQNNIKLILQFLQFFFF